MLFTKYYAIISVILFKLFDILKLKMMNPNKYIV